MATKFSIALKVKDGVVADQKITLRKDAQVVIDTFKKWRDEGAECYLFNAPEADKRSKETDTVVSLAPVPVVADLKNRMTKKAKEVADNLSL